MQGSTKCTNILLVNQMKDHNEKNWAKFISLKTLDTFKRQKMGLFLHYLSAKYFHFGNHTEKQYAKQIFAQID